MKKLTLSEYKRMDNLATAENVFTLDNAVVNIYNTLAEDGFEIDEIKTFIMLLVNEALQIDNEITIE